MKRFLLLLLVACGLSCDRPVYRQFDEFEDNRWPREEVKTFAFDISQAGDYDIALRYSHVYDTPYRSVPVTVRLESARENRTSETTIKLLDDDGRPLSDCAGDVCDLTQPLFEKTALAAGRYTVSVDQHFDYAYLPNAIGVGIEVRKSGQ